MTITKQTVIGNYLNGFEIFSFIFFSSIRFIHIIFFSALHKIHTANEFNWIKLNQIRNDNNNDDDNSNDQLAGTSQSVGSILR